MDRLIQSVMDVSETQRSRLEDQSRARHGLDCAARLTSMAPAGASSPHVDYLSLTCRPAARWYPTNPGVARSLFGRPQQQQARGPHIRGPFSFHRRFTRQVAERFTNASEASAAHASRRDVDRANATGHRPGLASSPFDWVTGQPRPARPGALRDSSPGCRSLSITNPDDRTARQKQERTARATGDGIAEGATALQPRPDLIR